MATKTINNIISLNRLVPTLLVYGVYLRISKLDPFAPSVIKQAAVIRKAMAEIVKLWTKQAVNSALYYYNGLNIILVYNLLLNFKVLVWCKSGNWTRLYHLLAVKDKIYCI